MVACVPTTLVGTVGTEGRNRQIVVLPSTATPSTGSVTVYGPEGSLPKYERPPVFTANARRHKSANRRKAK
jgi:hypothetical protein